MHYKWLDKPIPGLTGVSYRLKQISTLKFGVIEIKNVLGLQSMAEVENALKGIYKFIR